jgi:hypothetical protein
MVIRKSRAKIRAGSLIRLSYLSLKVKNQEQQLPGLASPGCMVEKMMVSWQQCW